MFAWRLALFLHVLLYSNVKPNVFENKKFRSDILVWPSVPDGGQTIIIFGWLTDGTLQLCFRLRRRYRTNSIGIHHVRPQKRIPRCPQASRPKVSLPQLHAARLVLVCFGCVEFLAANVTHFLVRPQPQLHSNVAMNESSLADTCDGMI